MLDLLFLAFFASSAATSFWLLLAICARTLLSPLRRARKGAADA
ncbi:MULTISPECIES: hypothetical protein [unclassified Kitasatospora]|nr:MULTISPECIES: hypothetical protein [unclassified Kitasatospora]